MRTSNRVHPRGSRAAAGLCLGVVLAVLAQHAQAVTVVNATVPCACAPASDGSGSADDSLSGPWYEVTARFLAIAFLIACSAMFSGLTLGLLSLDISGLEVRMLSQMLAVCVMRSGFPQIIIGGGAADSADVIAAKAILPVREKGNLLLCTLLIGNVAVNSLCSILMADLTSGLVGFFVSTFLIVILGEILPQAFCSRYALEVGRRLVPLVRVLVWMVWPVAKPISMVLDYALGKEMPTIYTKTQLSKLLQMQVSAKVLDVEESNIMAGAMRLKDHVSTVMTPLDRVFTLAADEKLDFATVSRVFQAGYSRIPVRETRGSNVFVGVLFTKDLILLDPEDAMPVQQVLEFFKRNSIMKVWADQTLQEALAMFRQTHTHLALVQTVNSEGDGDPFYEVQGLVTMEDIMEVILQSSIEDEFDDTGTQRGIFDYARLRLLDSTKTLNDLGDTEVDAIAAHLRTNCEAFQAPTAAGPALTMEETRGLLRGCPVLELKRPAPPSAKSRSAGSSDPGMGAITVPIQANVEAPVVRSTTAPRDPSMLESKGGPTPLGRVRSSTAGAQRDSDLSDSGTLYRRGKVDTYCTVVLSGKLKVTAGRDGFVSEVGAWSILGDDALTTPTGQYVPDFSAVIESDVVRCIRISHAQFQAALQNVALLPESSGGPPMLMATVSGHLDGRAPDYVDSSRGSAARIPLQRPKSGSGSASFLSEAVASPTMPTSVRPVEPRIAQLSTPHGGDSPSSPSSSSSPSLEVFSRLGGAAKPTSKYQTLDDS